VTSVQPPGAAETPFEAFIDESESDRSTDPDTYVLAAALLDPTRIDEVRDAMRALLLRGQRKLHWRDESDKRRLQIIEAVVAAQVEHLVVVRAGRTRERSERRRRLCLEALCFELERLGVRQATLESRGRADDRRDRVMLDTLRARKTVGGQLRMQHLPGPGEPLLWLPDAVCGAVTRARVGDVVYRDMVESQITVVSISARV